MLQLQRGFPQGRKALSIVSGLSLMGEPVADGGQQCLSCVFYWDTCPFAGYLHQASVIFPLLFICCSYAVSQLAAGRMAG